MKSFILNFYTNGGSSVGQAKVTNSCSEGISIENWPADPTRKHAIFNGWCYDRNLKVDKDELVTEYLEKYEDNYIIYAKLDDSTSDFIVICVVLLFFICFTVLIASEVKSKIKEEPNKVNEKTNILNDRK